KMRSPICGNDSKKAAPATAISKNNSLKNFGNISRPCANGVKRFWPISHTSTTCSSAALNEQIKLLIRSCNACAALLGYSGNLLSSDEMTILQFHIVPNAKQNKVMHAHGGAIKIRLRASALEGKANAALISFLAEELKIPARAIVLER